MDQARIRHRVLDQPSPYRLEIERLVEPADPLAHRPELSEWRQLGPAAEYQKPHGVEQHQERADLVQDRRGHRAEDAERGQNHGHGIEPEGKPDDVLADDPHRGAGQLDQRRAGSAADRPG